MKILVLGNDRSLFESHSESLGRIREYAGLFEELHIVVFTLRGFTYQNFDKRLFLWPTNSFVPAFWLPSAILQSIRIIRDRKIDIIDAQDAGFAGLAAYFAALFSGVPFRVQIHTDIFSPYYKMASWKERMQYLLTKIILPKASCIRVVSGRIKFSIEKRYKALSPINSLPIFTDISRYVSAIPDRNNEERFSPYKFKIISAGRFVEKEKNFMMLIEVMAEFIKVCPEAILVIVGDGPDKDRYKTQIIQYGLEKNVIIEGWRNDLPTFYKSFDLFVLPSNYEGWGRVIIEAMASGLPVVMTDVGLAGEVVRQGRNGIVIPVRDYTALRNALRDLYIDAEKRQKIAAAGAETVKNLRPFTKEEYLILYKESLQKCLNS